MFLLKTTIVFALFHWMFLKFIVNFFFFNPKYLSLSIEECMWLSLNFPFEKFHSDIHNKMTDNNGTDLPHAADSDVSFGLFYLNSYICHAVWRLSISKDGDFVLYFENFFPKFANNFVCVWVCVLQCSYIIRYGYLQTSLLFNYFYIAVQLGRQLPF